MQEQKQVFIRLMEETYRASQEVQGRDGENVFIGGASQMLESPEFANVEKMRALFKAFEDKYKLLKLLDRSVRAEGIKVFIGSENPYFEVQGCSMVVSNYQVGANVVGTLGVIGPTRMQYKQVIQVVDYTAKLLSRLLGRTPAERLGSMKKHRDEARKEDGEVMAPEGEGEGEGVLQPSASDAETLMKELMQALAQKTQEAAEANEKYLRTYADFDNYRKRMQRDLADFRHYANEQLALELLPVIDHLGLALKHAGTRAGERSGTAAGSGARLQAVAGCA